MDYLKISKVADSISNKYETRNPFKIASFLGINLIFQEIQHLKGFYTYILKNRYIVINSSLDEISAKVVCAHEIGHDRLHKKLGVNMFQDEMCISLKTSTPEIEANYFAAQLLIPDDIFLELLANNHTYHQLACELNVHPELVLLKAQLLINKGYNLNIPYSPKSNYLTNTQVAEEKYTYINK